MYYCIYDRLHRDGDVASCGTILVGEAIVLRAEFCFPFQFAMKASPNADGAVVCHTAIKPGHFFVTSQLPRHHMHLVLLCTVTTPLTVPLFLFPLPPPSSPFSVSVLSLSLSPENLLTHTDPHRITILYHAGQLDTAAAACDHAVTSTGSTGCDGHTHARSTRRRGRDGRSTSGSQYRLANQVSYSYGYPAVDYPSPRCGNC